MLLRVVVVAVVAVATGDGAGLDPPASRSMVSSDWNMWPNGEVPYKFGDSTVDKNAIRNAMATLERDSCLKFKFIDKFLYFGAHLMFRSHNSQCSSYHGRQKLKVFGQDLYLSKQCTDSPILLLRQIATGVGLYREEVRNDRDAYISLMFQNIRNSDQDKFSVPWQSNTYGVPYDYYSIMHAKPTAYSKNGATTIYAKDPLKQGLMALQRKGLSFMDKLLINKAYECTDRWLSQCNEVSNPCQNMGYMDSSCKCVCPPGTDEDRCTKKSQSYDEALMSTFLPLNEEITENGFVNSSTPRSDETVFTKIITAPSCNKVNLTFTNFDTVGRCGDNSCCKEGLEINTSGKSSPTSGKWFCGREISVGQSFFSAGDSLIVFYARTAGNGNEEGFNAIIDFQPIAGCTG